ncbi:sugar kinase [Roseomonas sp. OT10]|uniref:sugar kinase n=1 Tax=Roseomonas cutis TaxID=2897332 RepID=UPI001E299C29|nr:sugar kinase [Roseomonas sp. OT10]UFN51310.1 sugar kinase [Roseomonas sp. OT10]
MSLDPAARSRVACLGECMVELRERSDGLLSRGFGGDTLNTAVYMARLGMSVDYVTALGDDPFSAEMLAGWEAEGVGTGLIPRVPGRVPGLYLIQTDAKGERRFSYWRDSAPVRQLFTLDETPRVVAGLARFGLVYLSGITLSLFRGESSGALFAALEGVRAAGGRIAFDTNFRPRGWPDREEAVATYDRMARLSDIVLAGSEDHGLLTGTEPDMGAVERWLRAAGVTEMVIKSTQPGCQVIHPGGMRLVRTKAVQPVDTTAAGDSFAAAYLAAREAGLDPVQAARAGHRLAGEVILHPGAIIPREAMPADVLHPSPNADAEAP